MQLAACIGCCCCCSCCCHCCLLQKLQTHVSAACRRRRPAAVARCPRVFCTAAGRLQPAGGDPGGRRRRGADPHAAVVHVSQAGLCAEWPVDGACVAVCARSYCARCGHARPAKPSSPAHIAHCCGTCSGPRAAGPHRGGGHLAAAGGPAGECISGRHDCSATCSGTCISLPPQQPFAGVPAACAGCRHSRSSLLSSCPCLPGPGTLETRRAGPFFTPPQRRCCPRTRASACRWSRTTSRASCRPTIGALLSCLVGRLCPK